MVLSNSCVTTRCCSSNFSPGTSVGFILRYGFSLTYCRRALRAFVAVLPHCRITHMRIPTMISGPPPAALPAIDESPVAALPRVRPLKIGPLVVDPPLFQAPMAGFTNYAYRQVVREFGG